MLAPATEVGDPNSLHSMTPALRKSFLWLHTWTGLVVGLLLLLVSLTGAVLVFRPSLEWTLDAQRFVVSPGTTRLSLEELATRARAAHPANELESLRMFGDPASSVWFYFTNKDYVHVNPYTGAILGTRARYGEGFGWVEGLHKYLLLETNTGETVNGTLALIFSGIVLTGFVLWWPATRRALKAGLTLNPKLSGRPWQLNLHKTIGVYAAGVVLLSALTGLPIALDWVKAGLYPLTFSQKIEPPKPTKSAASGPAFAGFDAIARRIESLMPGARETYIPLPKKGVIPAYAIAADGPHPMARSYVWFNPSDGAVLRFTPYEANVAGFRLYYWMMAIHTGVVGGWVVKIILLLGTLSVPVLVYTGTVSFLGRKSRKHAPAPAKLPASSTVAIP